MRNQEVFAPRMDLIWLSRACLGKIANFNCINYNCIIYISLNALHALKSGVFLVSHLFVKVLEAGVEDALPCRPHLKTENTLELPL
eukprot:COSAG06_NODE_1535_length_9155_cov_68.266343_8_plen_86_part_00